MSESYFDKEKPWYVFEYIVDPVSGEPTEYAGEIKAFVKAVHQWEAIETAGFDDYNAYGANVMDETRDFDKFTKSIADERKLLKKISKELKGFIEERDAKTKEFLKDRPCPNGCGKLDEKFRCPNCRYGFEAEELIKELDKAIKDAKKNGEDTSDLEAVRDSLQTQLDE